MSHQNGEATTVGSRSEPTSLLARVTASARRHVEQWGRRYVEMRVDARQ